MKLVYEVNGSDQFSTRIHSPLEQTMWGLIESAKYYAEKHGVPLSDVTLRFVEG